MNNRMLYIALAMVFFMCCFILIILTVNHFSITELRRNAAVITKDVNDMRDSVKKREIDLADKINFSMDKISELVRNKNMTMEEIKSLENSIKYEQMKLEELKKNMKEW